MLQKDLRIEHVGARLASCPVRHIALQRPWLGSVNHYPGSRHGEVPPRGESKSAAPPPPLPPPGGGEDHERSFAISSFHQKCRPPRKAPPRGIAPTRRPAPLSGPCHWPSETSARNNPSEPVRDECAMRVVALQDEHDTEFEKGQYGKCFIFIFCHIANVFFNVFFIFYE